MTNLAAGAVSAADPTLASFSPLVWWIIAIKVVVIFLFLLLFQILMIWAERRVIGRMQNRPGPNRWGPFGLLQPVADALKLPLKEDIVPRQVDKLLFFLAPILSAVPALISFAIIPVGPEVSIFGVHTPLQLTDFPVAVLLVLAMSSIAVYGIVLAGWSSTGPYSLLGGLRSSAQVISYEIAMGLSFVPVFLYAGIAVLDQHRAGPGQRRRVPPVRRRPALVRRGSPSCCCPSFLIYLLTMVGRDQPAAVRPARGRGRAGRRVPHRVLLAAVRALLPRRVRQHAHRLRASPPRSSSAAGGRSWPLTLWSGANTGWYPILWFLAKVVALRVRLHLAARLAAPGPLRPAHGPRLEGPHPRRPSPGLLLDRHGPRLAVRHRQGRSVYGRTWRRRPGHHRGAHRR
jgi:NADH-quinone oxidoreductase subunit H